MSFLHRLPEEEAKAIAASGAHQVLAGLVRLPIEPASFTTTTTEGAWTVMVQVGPSVSVPDPDGPVLGGCKHAILSILASVPADQRRTTSHILTELERRGLIHSEVTVKRALAGMVRAGQISSSRTSPRGYSLPHVFATSS